MKALIILLGVNFSLNAGVFDRVEKDFIEGHFNYVELSPNDGRSSYGRASIKKLEASFEGKYLSIQNKQQVYDFDLSFDNNDFLAQSPSIKSRLRLSQEVKDVLYRPSYLEAFNSDFYADASELRGSGKSLAVDYEDDQVFLENYLFFCDRNFYPSEKDLTKSIQKSCFNALEVSGEEKEDVFKMDIKESFDNALRSTISLIGKKFSLLRELVKANLTQFNLFLHKEKFKILTQDISFGCKKKADIDRLIKEDFLFPCLDSLDVEASLLKGESQEKEVYLEAQQLDLTTSSKVLSGMLNNLNLQGKDFLFDVQNASFVCQKVKNFDRLDLDSYVESCLDDLSLSSKDQKSLDLSLTHSAQKDTHVDVKNASLNLYPKDIVISGDQVSVSHDEGRLKANIQNARLKCAKKQGQKDLNIGDLVNDCKNQARVETSLIEVENQQTKGNPIFLKITPEKVMVTPQSFELATSSFKVRDAENLAVLKQVLFSCSRAKESDITKKSDIIRDCLNSAEFKTPVVMVLESELDTKEIKTSSRDYREEELSPTIKDVVLRINNGYLKMSIKPKIKLLGRRKISFEGPITYDPESSELRFKVKHTKLALGIRSNDIFMWAVKKFLAGETISVHGDEIKIKI